MMNIKGSDGASAEGPETTAEHPLRIAALRRFRAKLLDLLEDWGACGCVDLDGEGACTIQLDLGAGEFGKLVLRTDDTQ